MDCVDSRFTVMGSSENNYGSIDGNCQKPNGRPNSNKFQFSSVEVDFSVVAVIEQRRRWVHRVEQLRTCRSVVLTVRISRKPREIACNQKGPVFRRRRGKLLCCRRDPKISPTDTYSVYTTRMKMKINIYSAPTAPPLYGRIYT